MSDSTLAPGVEVHTYLGPADERSLADDVLDGLTRPFKELPPKHFYDTRGSELFEQICVQPEYYQTRTELQILRDRAADIVELTGAAELVELGSGASDKARILLDAMAEAGTACRYVPFDVSESTVHAAGEVLDYEGLQIYGVVGDFERHMVHLPEPAGPRLVAFLGGTVGNFPPGTRRRFLRQVAKELGPDGHLLLGTDLVKDPDMLEAAYNDAAGVTAEFNRNVLHVVNRTLDANFDVDAFEHVAFFDRRRQWIEMRLRSTDVQHVRIGDLNLEIDFSAREELRTEISAKFTPERLGRDLAAAGLELVEILTDPDGLFAVSLSRPA